MKIISVEKSSLYLYSILQNTLFLVSSQQNRQRGNRSPSLNPLRSHYKTFPFHTCVLSGETKRCTLSRYQSKEMKILTIRLCYSLLAGIEPATVVFTPMFNCATMASRIEYTDSIKCIQEVMYCLYRVLFYINVFEMQKRSGVMCITR